MKHLKKLLSVLLAALMIAALTVTTVASALDDGAYLVSRSTSYADPATGKTADGGTDIALGDSMCASITDDKVLVEKVGSKYYVTLGLGLMSNISNVRIATQTSGSNYKNVSITKTGSCQRDNDTCNHYRFQMDDPSKRIRVTFYVTPMSRDVIYFVDLNMNSATKGTGNFKAEMVKSGSSAGATKAATKASNGSSATTKGAVTKANTYSQDLYGEAEEDAAAAEDSDGGFGIMKAFAIGVAALVLLGIVAIVIVAKRR